MTEPVQSSLSRAANLTLRYHLSMVSLSPVHMVIVLTFMTILGRFNRLPEAVMINLALLVLVNVVGTVVLFRPIARFLSGGGDIAAARRRIKRLTPYSVGWGTFLVVALTVLAFGVLQPFCAGCDTGAILPFRVSMIVIFAVFCASYLYFLIGDFEALLKAELFESHGLVIRPGSGRLIHKFIVAFVAVGVLPVSLAFGEAFIFSELRPLMGIGRNQAFLFDLVIAAFMAITVFVFIQRNLGRPIASLLEAVRRVDSGDLSRKTPVITDDEFGVLACNLNQMIEGLNEREFLRKTFGRYVPQEVASAILANRGMIDAQRRVATILYSDIEGFTGVCETLSPEAVVTMLNGYFSAMVEIVHRRRGVVTQFQGDAMLVAFNVPMDDPNHARDAVLVAREIQVVVAERRFGDGLALPTRIGINTGTVVAGPVGAGDRLSYTVHGDAVNLAARLEQANKEFGTRIIVSDATRAASGIGLSFRPLGELAIRGKTQKIRVFAVD